MAAFGIIFPTGMVLGVGVSEQLRAGGVLIIGTIDD